MRLRRGVESSTGSMGASQSHLGEGIGQGPDGQGAQTALPRNAARKGGQEHAARGQMGPRGAGIVLKETLCWCWVWLCTVATELG